MTTELEERFWAKVNKTPGCWEWLASTSRSGYGQIREASRGSRMLLAHRLSYELAHGPIPNGKQIDIMCHVRSCMNPEHMRLVTNKQNAENQCGITKRNTSGVRGVTWDAARNLWLASARHNGRQIFAGRFASLLDAESAAIAKRLELFTHNEQDKAGNVATDCCPHTHARDMECEDK